MHGAADRPAPAIRKSVRDLTMAKHRPHVQMTAVRTEGYLTIESVTPRVLAYGSRMRLGGRTGGVESIARDNAASLRITDFGFEGE